MQTPEPVQKAIRQALGAAAALSFVAPLLTRATVGYSFFLTGRGKLENFANTVTFFTELGIPMPEWNAALVSRLEYYGGVLVALGLLTRFASAGLAGTMVVALAASAEDRQRFLGSWNPAVEWGPMDVSPWVFLMLLSWLVLYGPGIVSLDALLTRWLGLRAAGPANAERPQAA